MIKKALCISSILIVAVGAIMLYHNDPEGARWMPKCPVYVFTGLKCPSCGNTRAAYHLLHGDFAGAFMFNPMAIVLVPLVACLIFLCFGKQTTAKMRIFRNLGAAYVILYCGWFVARNMLGI